MKTPKTLCDSKNIEQAKLQCFCPKMHDREQDNLVYHWSDSLKKERDFIRIQSLAISMIPELTEKLNALHCLKLSVRQWHLIIGNWLNCFLTVYYDRFHAKEQSFPLASIDLTQRLDQSFYWSIPIDTKDAMSQFCDVHWNRAFIGLLNAGCQSSLVGDFDTKDELTEERRNHNSVFRLQASMRDALRRTWYFGINLFLNMGRSGSLYVLSDSGLTFWQYIKLRRRVSGKIFIKQEWPTSENVPYDPRFRLWNMEGGSAGSSYETNVRVLIPKFMPKSFLEGFSHIQQKLKCSRVPGSPNVIYTTNKHFYDDVFNIWTSGCIASGSKLIVGLHGGGVPYKFHSSLRFEEQICDYYVVPGSGYENYEHARDVGQFWGRIKYGKREPNGCLLIVTMITSRYAVDLRSMVMSRQMIEYYEEISNFYQILEPNIRNAALLRLQQPIEKFGWDVKSYWSDRCPNLILDMGTSSISKSVRRSRLCVSTYMGSFFMESLAANIPTVIFWRDSHFQYHTIADEDFDTLRSVGIFHDTAYSAASFVAQIWPDIIRWWSRKDVQDARLRFCNRYGRRDAYMIERLANVFMEASGRSFR